jgi:hypothetical protein
MSIYKRMKRTFCIAVVTLFALTFIPHFAVKASADPIPDKVIGLTDNHINEYDKIGTPVGDVTVTPYNGENYTFKLTDDDGGNFKINTGERTIRSSKVLEYDKVTESNNIRHVTVEVTDGTYTSVKDFDIEICSIYVPAEELLLSDNKLAENSPDPTTVGTLSVGDDEDDNALYTLDYSYDLVDGWGSTDNSKFCIDGDELAATSAFDYEEQETASIRVEVTKTIEYNGTSKEEYSEKVLKIKITDVNEAPEINDSSKTAEKDETLSFAAADFTDNYSDPEEDELASVKITELPSADFGTLKIDGADITDGQKIDAADLGKITFVPVPLKVGETSFTWKASDGDLWSNKAELTINTADTKAPLWTPGYPTVTDVTSSTAKLNVSINEKGTVYFVAVPKGSPAPTSAQIKAGKTGTGADAAANMKGSVNVEASTAAVMNVTGLASSTEYDFYLTAEDIYFNIQVQPTLLAARTLDLVVKGTVTDNTTGNVIDGAKLNLYYANTARNIAAGKVPGTLVTLPVVSGVTSTNPQNSSSAGLYSFLVYPTADYYIVATKDGYQTFTSYTIMVESESVVKDIKMSVIPLVQTGSPLDAVSLGFVGLGSIAAGLGLLRKKEK